MKKFAVIMAGGSGTRFWPKSSIRNPKQFLALTGTKSQLQLTWDRLQGVVPTSQRIIVSTELLKKTTLRHIKGASVLAEPMGRNTMAAVCWSAWSIGAKNPNAVIAVLPADAYIEDVSGFKKALETAYTLAEEENRIVCLGIKPTFPATAYGYIQQGSALSGEGFQIEKFVEKPEALVAQTLYLSGEFLWNAGIFVFSVELFKNEVRKHAPEFAAFFDKNVTPKKIIAGYKKLPSVSIDVALMEKTSQGALLSGSFGWNDLGSWPALAEVMPSNCEAGLVQAPGGSLSIESKNIVANVTEKKFLGLIGVEDLIVVETETSILICKKDRAQDIKKLTSLIEKDKKLSKRLL